VYNTDTTRSAGGILRGNALKKHVYAGRQPEKQWLHMHQNQGEITGEWDMKDKWWIFLVIGVVILVGAVAFVSGLIGHRMGRAEAQAQQDMGSALDSETQERIESALENMGSEIESALDDAGSDLESALSDANEEISSALSDAASNLTSEESGETAGKTLTAEADLADLLVAEIEINWAVGHITILPGDHVSLKEYSSDTVEEQDQIEYYANGATLYINEYKDPNAFSGGFNYKQHAEKDLVLTLPADLHELRLNIVAADVTAEEGLTVDRIKLNGVSSVITMKDLHVRCFDIDVVDAAITLTYAAVPEEIDLDSVGGTFLITLPEGTGFTAEISSIGGELTTVQGTGSGNANLVIGDGSVEIEIDTVSGKVTIQ